MSEFANLQAVVFDMDGVLADTEANGHRVAFNETFEELGIPVRWSVELYGELLAVSGGKERMRRFFADNLGMVDADDTDRIAELHKIKTAKFQALIETGAIPPRPGAARLLNELKDSGLPFAIATTANEKSAHTLLESLFGRETHDAFAVILAGDVVKKKKPDPEIYTMAAERLGIDPRRSVVVEDTRVGLLASRAAGFVTCVTVSQYSRDEGFSEAEMVLSCLGDGNEPCEVIKSPVDLIAEGQCAVVDLDRLVEACG